MTDKVRPCPWCGRMPVLCVREKLSGEDEEPYFKYSVACMGSGLPQCHIKPHTRYWHHKEEAMYYWNKRASQ